MILNIVKTAQYSFTNNWQTFFLHSMLINHGGWWWWSGQWGGGRVEGARGKSKKEFEITCFGIVCRSGFLTQFQRHGKTACDRCQKEENYIAWEHCTRKSICQGFSFNMGDLKHLCVCRRMMLP